VPRRSAGLLPFHLAPGGEIEVFIVHPGGPYYVGRDEASWSIAKGEYGGDEDPLAAARREFAEEVGRPAPDGPFLELGEIRQPGGKLVVAWAVDALPGALSFAGSNLFELEWPPRSGRRAQFPEVDRAEWCSEAEARRRLGKGQVAFVDRLLGLVAGAAHPGAAADRRAGTDRV